MNGRRRALEAALATRDLEAAWAVVEEVEASSRDDALLLLALADADPSRPELAARIEAVAGAHRTDAEVQVAACAALLAVAGRRPMDAPALADGPAALALRLAEACLEASPPAALAPYLHINRANALRALGRDRDAEAREAYAAALAHPEAPGGWYVDLGVLHKWRGRWDSAADAFAEARARLGETRRVLWNQALVATARGRGAEAEAHWRALGFGAKRPADAAEGRLPEVPELPPLRLRVPAKASGLGAPAPGRGDDARSYEVVWVAPLTPGHGVVQSPTFEEAPVDYGDVVLWDGAPVAEERLGAAGEAPRALPVFPLLEVLRPGEERRLRFVAAMGKGDLDALLAGLPDGCRIFAHEGEAEGLAYGKLIVPGGMGLGDVQGRLEAVLTARRTLRFAVPALYEAVADAKRAGLEHQAWRGIERRAGLRGGGA